MVVIPLKNSPQPSGQSVCLQAMACGKVVILTRTDGLWSNETMRDSENVKFVPPGDKKALMDAIKQLVRDSWQRNKVGNSARETACLEGKITAFAGRLEAFCHQALVLES